MTIEQLAERIDAQFAVWGQCLGAAYPVQLVVTGLDGYMGCEPVYLYSAGAGKIKMGQLPTPWYTGYDDDYHILFTGATWVISKTADGMDVVATQDGNIDQPEGEYTKMSGGKCTVEAFYASVCKRGD